MDIYTYLIRDHRKVAALMQQVLESQDPQERGSLFVVIRRELRLHTEAEEQTFYKAITDATHVRSLSERINHSQVEHAQIRDYLKTLGDQMVDSPAWLKTFKAFHQCVTHHVEEEENQVFPKARRYLTEAQSYELVRDMDAAKNYLRDEVVA